MRLYKVCQLQPDQVKDAQHLLYEVYIKELGWKLTPNNKIGACCEDNRLRDAFENTAIWFGAYYKNKLIGCLRVIPNAAEVSRYLALSIKPNSVETNRMCIAKEHRRSLVIALMTLKGFFYCIKNGYTTVYGTVAPKTVGRLLRLGWQRTGIEFKYEVSDPETCVLLSLSITKIGVILYILRSILDLAKRNIRRY